MGVWGFDIEMIIAYRIQKIILKIVARVSQAKRAERSGF